MTQRTHKYQLYPFWDDEYTKLNYIQEPFNDPYSVSQWLGQGYQPKICGELCDMRNGQPTWNQRFLDIFSGQGWKNIGTAYYRMNTGTVMPTHSDLYKKYVEIFNLQGREHNIRRAIVFLEDWQPGHYLEVMGQPYTGWKAGYTVEWNYDTPHLAANIGLTPRYTLQITGHLDD
jgi:hypothetical protein